MMPLVVIQTDNIKKVPTILRKVYNSADNARDTCAKDTAVIIQQAAQEILTRRVNKTLRRRRRSTGQLRDSIHVEAVIREIGYYEYHVKSNLPYALWVEMGIHAPFGVPYSIDKSRDYTKSSFTGHHYFERAAEIGANKIEARYALHLQYQLMKSFGSGGK